MLPMMTRWMHGRHTDWYIQTYRAAKDHSCTSCLIKRFVCKKEGRWWPGGFSSINFPPRYSKSCIPTGGTTYWGHHILASFGCCQHAQAKHPLGLALSFFIVLFFLLLFTPSHLLSHSPHLDSTSFFPSQRWKPPHSSFYSSWSGPNEVAYLMNTPPSLERSHTDVGIYTLLILPCTLNTNTFRWRNGQEVFEVHNSTKYTSTEWENTHANLHMVCLESGQSLARDPGAWHLGVGCLAWGPWR